MIRFRLRNNEEIIEVEKQLLKKQSSWKLLAINFELIEIDKATTINLFEIFHQLDEQITGKTRMTYRSPEERQSNK